MRSNLASSFVMTILPLALSFATALPPRTEPVAADPPHIVFVMVDDLGWRDVSPALWTDAAREGPRAGKSRTGDNGAGSPPNAHFRTPHLERLAAGGLLWSDAYAAAPVCTPSRTSLLTGRSPARNQITYWTRYAGRDTSSAHATLTAPEWNVDGLQPGDVTLPRLLRDAGYRTVHVGKAHFGTGEGGDPKALGFDVNVAGWAAGAPASFLGVDGFSEAGRAEREERDPRSAAWDVPGLERYHGRDVYLTDVLAREAVRELRAAVEAGDRVFLHFAPYAVHAPLMVNARVASRFPELDGPELAYATMVASVDDALGSLLDAIEDLEIEEETLIVYTSDNGGLSAHSRGGTRHVHNAPLRSGKGSGYEGGTRVPLVVRWPGMTDSGRVERTPSVTHDWFPTLLAAAGASVPGAVAAAIEGVDLTPLFARDRGARVANIHRPLFWHQPHFWGVHGPGIEPYSAVRLGDFKLLHFHAGGEPAGAGRLELYDLRADIGETADLTREQPFRAAALAEVLSLWLEATDAGRSILSESGAPIALPRVAAGRLR